MRLRHTKQAEAHPRNYTKQAGARVPLILDSCCGTGRSTLRLAARNPGAAARSYVQRCSAARSADRVAASRLSETEPRRGAAARLLPRGREQRMGGSSEPRARTPPPALVPSLHARPRPRGGGAAQAASSSAWTRATCASVAPRPSDTPPAPPPLAPAAGPRATRHALPHLSEERERVSATDGRREKRDNAARLPPQIHTSGGTEGGRGREKEGGREGGREGG